MSYGTSRGIKRKQKILDFLKRSMGGQKYARM
jgi:hypothetical protein